MPLTRNLAGMFSLVQSPYLASYAGRVIWYW